MQIDPNPVFRKIIIPWYDLDSLCFVQIFFMDMVMLFGIAGISAAYDQTDFYNYIGVPILLVSSSLGVMISTSIRLIKRFLAL
ncbi:MAG: hypothetical protein HQK79_00690 [Desulfobacterales bacterium]|nr:hypothetical protein [Desulfobacterales bacterium]